MKLIKISIKNLFVLSLLIISYSSFSQSLTTRDPTADLATPLPPKNTNTLDTVKKQNSMVVITKDNVKYIAVGTRLYKQGDKLSLPEQEEISIIDKINSNEIWFKTGNLIKKVPIFNGIKITKLNTTLQTK